MGTIKRSNSKLKNEERPSTAPAKDNKPDEKNLTGGFSMKRLPSPAVKCKRYLILANNLLSNTTKNSAPNYNNNNNKYRSQSPANPIMKSSSLNGNKIGLGNSLKTLPMNILKKKWK